MFMCVHNNLIKYIFPVSLLQVILKHVLKKNKNIPLQVITVTFIYTK